MKVLPTIHLLIAVILALVARQALTDQAGLPDKNELDLKLDFKLINDLNNIKKRSVGSVILYVFFSSVQLGTYGKKLYDAITEGCGTHKEICEERDEIERLEGEMEKLSDEYEYLFYKNQERLLGAYLAVNNSNHVTYYLEKIIEAVEIETQDIDTILETTQLDELGLRQMYEKHDNDEEFLENLIVPLSKVFDDTKSLITYYSNNQAISLAVQKISELLYKNLDIYTTELVRAANIPDVDQVNVFEILLKDENQDTFPNNEFLNKLKTLLNEKATDLAIAFKTIGTDIKSEFGSFGSNEVSNWMREQKYFQSLKTNVWAEKQQTIMWTRMIHLYLRKVPVQKYTTKGFTFKPFKQFLNWIGLIVDLVEIFIIDAKWDQVLEETRNTRKEYEAYLGNLTAAIKDLKEQEVVIDEYWENTTNHFVSLIKTFNNITDTARGTVYSEVYGLDKVEIDKSHPFYQTDFETVNVTEIDSKQKIAIDFFLKTYTKISDLTLQLKCRETLFSITKHEVSKDTHVADMYATFKLLYEQSSSDIQHLFGKTLSLKDVVCTAAMVSPDRTTYDYYPLSEFRAANCAISDSVFEKMKEEAEHQQLHEGLYQTVQNGVPLDRSVAVLLSSAKPWYIQNSNPDYREFGNNLSRKDIVCAISIQFPSMDSYKFFPLTVFRPDCNQVTDQEFQEIDDKATRMSQLKINLDYIMPNCIATEQNCPCPDTFINYWNIPADDVMKIFNLYKPNDNCSYKTTSPCKWVCG